MRGQMPNQDDKLFPGMFVRVKLPAEMINNAILVQEKAINSDIGGKFLFIVDANDTVHTSYIKEGKKIGDFRIVLSGVNGSEKYVLSGFHLIRPGMVIKPMLQSQKSALETLTRSGN